MFSKFKIKGFTLIEVLVVVSIIGILSSLIYVNFNEARNNARNRAMQTELKEVQLALELYKSQNGHYPPAENITAPPYASCTTEPVTGTYQARQSQCGPNIIITEFVPEFISELPNRLNSANPSNCDLVYKVDGSNGSWYKLVAENCLADVNDTTGTQSTDELALCPKACENAPGTCGANTMNETFADTPAFYQSLAVYSPGGTCK